MLIYVKSPVQTKNEQNVEFMYAEHHLTFGLHYERGYKGRMGMGDWPVVVRHEDRIVTEIVDGVPTKVVKTVAVRTNIHRFLETKEEVLPVLEKMWTRAGSQTSFMPRHDDICRNLTAEEAEAIGLDKFISWDEFDATYNKK